MEYLSEYPGVVHFEKKGHVAYIRFDNPKTLNALSPDMMDSLDTLFTAMNRDNDIWGVIMTGTGKAFMSGADLSGEALAAANDDVVVRRREWRVKVHQLYDKIADFPRPVIAAINGYALGGGAELALCCDFRIASKTAKIGFPEPKLGLHPGYGGPSRAIRIMGITNAKQMLYTGDFYTAEEAKELTFLSKVAEPEELMSVCEALMSRMTDKAPFAIKFAKILCNRGTEMSLQSCLEFERLSNVLLTTTEDSVEGYNAFVEKRPAEYKNK